MSPVKKPQTKVVDSLKTQLEELLASLNKLYDTLNTELDRVGSDFDEVNTILVEGFRNVLDREPPLEVVPDAPSDSSEGESDEDDSGDESEEDHQLNDEEENKARAESADALVRMIQSWTAGGH